MAGDNDQRAFIYRIDAQDRISFVNREWADFAKENEAPELTPEAVLGQPLERFLVGWETRHLYELIYARVRRMGQEVRLPFNCDSPTLRRAFSMRIIPLEEAALAFVVEVLEIEPRPPRPLLDNRIEHAAEFVLICSWCKRIRIAPERWIEIEEAAEAQKLFAAPPPSLTHGVCPDCLTTIQCQLDKRCR